MTTFRSAITAVLLCFLLALTLSGCGKSSSAASTTTTTTASDIQMAVSAGNNQVTVSWTDPSSTSASNATYNIYCSNTAPDATKKDDGTLIASNVTSPFVHTGLINGQTYYYFVTKVTGSTEGPASQYASAVPMPTKPSAPTAMTISSKTQQGKGSVTITIPNADSTLQYNVYWSTTGNVTTSNGTKISNAFTMSGTTASFTHYNLTNDGSTTYYYIITAVGDSESGASLQLSASPQLKKSVSYSAGPPAVSSAYGSPDNLSATIANQQVTINWNATTDSPAVTESGNANTSVAGPTYNVYWWPDSGSRPSTPTVANADQTKGVIFNSLTNGTTYHVVVTAVQTVKVTDPATSKVTTTTSETDSSAITVIPQAKKLATPGAVSASAGDQKVSLSWAAVTDPTGGTVKYNLYCTNTPPTNTTVQSNWSLIGTTTSTSYVHSGLTTGKTYYYVITSVSDQSGESAATWTTSQVSIKL